MNTIYTIGFTRRTAENFFEKLKKSGARHLLDIRLSNTSQLAGFTKKPDLIYFLKSMTGMLYHEVKGLAPTEAIFNEYHADRDWDRLQKEYVMLLQERKAEQYVPSGWLKEGAVLLCSEHEPDHCHRRLAAEYLAQHYQGSVNIVHL
jgi:uncharacterized protein (DUF488 family)